MLCPLLFQTPHDDSNMPLNYHRIGILSTSCAIRLAQSLHENSPSLPALSYRHILPLFFVSHPPSMRTLNSHEIDYLGTSGIYYSIINIPKMKYLSS